MTADFGLELLPPAGLPVFENNLRMLPSFTKYFSTIWICDHFQFGGGKPWFEGWTTLSYLAAKFPEYKYGNLVIGSGYRNPALLAKMAATLVNLSGKADILTLGLGAGWDRDEYVAYGYDFPPYSERVERLREVIEIVRKLWDESPASYQGKFYRIKNAYVEPRPKQRIPILVGGSGKAVLRVVARYADAWNEAGKVGIFKPSLQRLQTACDEMGRNINEIKMTCIVRPSIPEDPGDFRQDSLNRLIGPKIDDIITELHSLADLGVSHFQVRVSDPRTLAVFCEEVISDFKK
ncbi:MAG: LLM class flavin-dependent oxidoreductase [Nitrososphaerales archaeon]